MTHDTPSPAEHAANDQSCGCGPDCRCGPNCACGPNGRCSAACACAG